MSWTDERVELLRKLWGEGHTAAEIAKKLGQVTRNAVIGKAHRLKLPSRVSPIKSAQKKKIKPANTNVKPAKAPAARTAKKEKSSEKMPPTLPKTTEEIGGKIPLADIKAGQCRWPNGDPQKEDFGFCGKHAMTGLPYCQEHAQIGYQAATRNRILKSQKMLADIEAAAVQKKAAS